jgi:hypothetical protein
VSAEIDEICSPRWVSRVMTTTLAGVDPATFRLEWQVDTAAEDVPLAVELG